MSDNTVRVLQRAASDLILGEAVVVDPEVAWTGLQELHRRALGESVDFRLPGIAEMTPIQAFDAYERANAVALAQIGVFPAEFADGVVTSIETFAREHGSLDGLDGLLLSASLAAAGAGGGDRGLDRGASGAGARAHDLFRDLGIPERLGAGRGMSHVLDAGTGGLANLARDGLESLIGSPTPDLTELLRAAVSAAAEDPGNDDEGGGGLLVLRGLVEIAAGALCALVYPPSAEVLLADGTKHVVSGLATLAHGEPAHGAPPSPTPGGEHGGGGHSSSTFTTTHVVHTRVVEHPDGTKVEERRETYTTTGIVTDVRPKGHGGSGDRLWDDSGGGFDEESGRPRPIDPLTTLLCPPHPDGPEEPGAPLALPKVAADGRVEGFGAYDILDAVLEAFPVDGVIDATAEIAAAADPDPAPVLSRWDTQLHERGASTPDDASPRRNALPDSIEPDSQLQPSDGSSPAEDAEAVVHAISKSRGWA